MYAVILAGGSGARLWPLSRELYPKQFLPLPGETIDLSLPNEASLLPGAQVQLRAEDRPVESENEGDPSLFEATIHRTLPSVPENKILIVTHINQAGEIRRRLSRANLSGVRLLEEPEARNTAPAIGLAAWFLRHEEGPDAVMAVLPSDHLIPNRQHFTTLLQKGAEAALTYGLVTFGIRPVYPETGYGYIRRGERLDQSAYRVEKFIEKPDLKTAGRYLEDCRYLWNSGMFVFRVGALIDQYRLHLPKMHKALERIDYAGLPDLARIYPGLEKISIDYGILERAADVTVIPADIAWSDLGSWEAYHRSSVKDKANNYIKGRVIPVESENSLLISTSRLVGAVGLKDLVVVETGDALLVCDRNRTQDVKKVVEQLNEERAVEAREHRTVYRPWGSYTSLELGDTYQVKRINVYPGARLSLQSHNRRSENWTVVSGEALVTIGDRQLVIKKGESAFIPTGAAHRMENRGGEELVLIEVQNGDYLGEDDIIRYEDDYGRLDRKSSPPGIE